MRQHPRARRRLHVLSAAVATLGLIICGGGVVSAVAAPDRASETAAVASSAPLPTPRLPAASTADSYSASPYMGWSSYSMQVDTTAKWITAAQITGQSDAMHGALQKAGYDYINVDSGWTDRSDANGRPAPSTTLFPQGLQKVIDHVHANGQKFGLYLIPGISPAVYAKAYPIANAPGCTTRNIVKQPLQTADAWGIGYRLDFTNPCAQKYVDSVVDQLSKWGVNFLKFDSVTPGSGVSDLSLDARDDVAAWSSALKKHNIWFELSWAVDINYADLWRKEANGWRVEWDVECYCGGAALTTWDNIDRLFPDAASWWRYGGDGGWNDFDSLDIGNGKMDGLTRDERQTAMTLWSISAAPLSIGNDLTNLDSYGVGLLTNPEVIAVDQAGTPARPVSTATKLQTWYALNKDGSYTVALFNLGQTDADVTAKFADIGLTGPAVVRDLWSHKDLGVEKTGITADDVPIHGSRLFTVTPVAGSTVTVNDDALRVGYGGDWTRNGGNEVAATSQPLGVTVANTGTPAPPSTTGPSRTTSVNDSDPGIVYTGKWGTSSGRGFGDFNDDVHYAQNVGDSFSYTFTGTGISYLTEIDPSEGDADVSIDDKLVKTVSANSDASHPHVPQQTVFSATDLTSGKHTLKVVMKSGTYLLVDRLDVTQQGLLDPASVSFDKKAPVKAVVKLLRDPGELTGITLSGVALKKGTDFTLSGTSVTITPSYLATLPVGASNLDFAFRGDLLDDEHATATNGDSVSYSFRGSGVDWVTSTAPDQGMVDIYIDGTLSKRIDTHSDSRQTQQDVFSVRGLKLGSHTFMAVKESGDVMRTDALRYTVR